MRSKLLAFLTVLTLHARAWTVGPEVAADYLEADPRLVRWSASASRDPVASLEYTLGLSGGITWAWAPGLCDKMVHSFPEEEGLHGWIPFPELISCDELQRAMAHAMKQWQAHLQRCRVAGMVG